LRAYRFGMSLLLHPKPFLWLPSSHCTGIAQEEADGTAHAAWRQTFAPEHGADPEGVLGQVQRVPVRVPLAGRLHAESQRGGVAHQKAAGADAFGRLEHQLVPHLSH
jgi:hypothetical protein